MSRKLLMAIALAAIVASAGYAQRRGGGGGGFGGGGFGAPARATKGEQFGKELKLKKEQTAEVQQILNDALKKAAPVNQQLNEARVKLVQMNLKNEPTDEAVKQLAAIEAQMLAIEADAMSQVMAKLDDKQKERVPKAYEYLSGMFQVTPQMGGGGRRGN